MRINTNVQSLITQHHLRNTNSSIETSMERLASGSRINSAADDAAGLGIATRMQSATRGMDVALRNTLDGVSMLQTAESAMGSMTNILQRMRDLAVQADNGTNGTDDIASLDTEFQALKSELDEIVNNTTFNGNVLLGGAYASTALNIHVSEKFDDVRGINIAALDTTTLGIAADALTGGTSAQTAIGNIDTSIDTITTARSTIGSTLNRLNFIMDNLSSAKTNLSSARSRIEDADMAAEMSELTKNKILTQSGMSMLAQSNMNPQMILSLLQP